MNNDMYVVEQSQRLIKQCDNGITALRALYGGCTGEFDPLCVSCLAEKLIQDMIELRAELREEINKRTNKQTNANQV